MIPLFISFILIASHYQPTVSATNMQPTAKVDQLQKGIQVQQTINGKALQWLKSSVGVK